MKLQGLGGWCLVGLFLASVLIVVAWLFQHLLNTLRTRGATEKRPVESVGPTRPLSRAGGVWGFLLKLRSGGGGGGGGHASEAGVGGLLASLFSFKSFKEHWQRAWLRALNEQARRHGSSIQITFDSSLQLTTSAAIERVTCVDQSANSMVLQCQCSVETMTFPVTVTQQSPAAVSMDTYYVTVEPTVVTLVVHLEEVEEEGLMVSWTLSKQPSLSLIVSPRRLGEQGSDGEEELNVIKDLMEDALFSTQAAVIFNLRTCDTTLTVPAGNPSGGLVSATHGVPAGRILLRQLRATCHKGQWSRPGELCCVLSLDQPCTERRTGFACPPGNPAPFATTSTSLEWNEDVLLTLSSETKELRIRLLQRRSRTEQFLPGHATIPLDVRRQSPSGQHVLSVSPGHGLAPEATVTLELLYVESEAPRGGHAGNPLGRSLTPSKKVDVDRTVMPDGTIVTTVTTVQSRPKLERNPGDAPFLVEATEQRAAALSGSRNSTGSASSDTAIRQLTEAAGRVARKTPTKRSTLIISGVAKVPLSGDDNALSVGYAAAMDAAMHANHYGAGLHQDPEETTPSDVSERPSVDDVESDTGSTGALETRSLKDHKVGFLQSGTKLWFRRRRREKDPSFSQSHEDVSDAGNDFVPPAAGRRKTSGSFSRRLIKRFSFRSSVKSRGKAGAANGGANAVDK